MLFFLVLVSAVFATSIDTYPNFNLSTRMTTDDDPYPPSPSIDLRGVIPLYVAPSIPLKFNWTLLEKVEAKEKDV